ncbi:MAG: CrcB family protein [Pseudonocardiales bacterium]
MPTPPRTGDLRAQLPIVGVIALGGGIGSVLRYGLAWAVPAAHGGFPVATLITNLLGSLLLGALVVAVTEIWRPHRLVRPAFGTGLLGGFTTFSTFAVDTRALALPVAVAYAVATVAGGLVLAAVGIAVVRRLEQRLQVAPVHELVDPFDPDLP